MVRITRTTTESRMVVAVSEPPVREDYRKKIVTPIPFLSHMIEHIVWRSGLGVETQVETGEFYLSHVVCEDLGITMGKAFGEYARRSVNQGIYGFGDGIGVIDEARALAAVSFESRAYFDFDYGFMPESTEGMLSEDLVTFLEGFAQGAQCTVHIELKKGVNGHHIWEAIFRAFGLALGRALEIHPERKGMTAGVAGSIQWEVE